MRLPRTVHNQLLYMLERTSDLRSGRIPSADPRWLECINHVLENTPRQEMRDFFEQFFVQGLSCDEILYNLFIERSTLYGWRDYFLWNVALEAADAGLLRLRA